MAPDLVAQAIVAGFQEFADLLGREGLDWPPQPRAVASYERGARLVLEAAASVCDAPAAMRVLATVEVDPVRKTANIMLGARPDDPEALAIAAAIQERLAATQVVIDISGAFGG